MKRAITAITVIAAFCLTVSSAYSSDFKLTGINVGPDTYDYTLINRHEVVDIVEWTLHWNRDDWFDDMLQGMANFDSNTGLVPPLPAYWVGVSAVFPWYYTGSVGSIKHGGGTQTGFKVKYGTPGNNNPVTPRWFTITYLSGQTRITTQMMPITGGHLPEPGSATLLIAGLCGAVPVLRRKAR